MAWLLFPAPLPGRTHFFRDPVAHATGYYSFLYYQRFCVAHLAHVEHIFPAFTQ